MQLVERLVPAPNAPAAGADGADAPADAPGTVMELMAGDRLVPSGSERYEAGLRQFRANLAALLERYRAARVPAFVGTLVSNERDQPPLARGDAPAEPEPQGFAASARRRIRSAVTAGRQASREAQVEQERKFQDLTGKK